MRTYWVNKRLAFGGALSTKRHLEQLRAVGITHVINLQRDGHNKNVRQFKNLWLPFRDDKKPRPAWFYRRALRFYGRALSRPRSKIFVMCYLGICRSASLAYFLLRASGLDEKEAAKAVMRARERAKIVRAYRESSEEFLIRNRIA